MEDAFFIGLIFEELFLFEVEELYFNVEQTPHVRPPTQYLQKLQVVHAEQLILPTHLLLSGIAQQFFFVEFNRSPKGTTSINSKNSFDMLMVIM